MLLAPLFGATKCCLGRPWSLQEKFKAYVKKTFVKKKEEEQQVLSGWFNEEQMVSELKWSKTFGSISRKHDFRL